VSQLRAFAALADHLHFRDAASALRMSQPALSGAVAALEESLGAQLVERTTRRVMLTPAGERVAEHARQVLDRLDHLIRAAVVARRPLTGPLRLGVIPTVAPYLLPVLLRPLRERFPDLEPHVHEEQTEDLLDGLHAGRLDLLLLALLPGWRGVAVRPLYDEHFTLVVPEGHPLAGQVDLDRSVLADLAVLLLDEGHCLRDQTLDVCGEAGASEHAGTRAASLATLVQLVAGGLGVTLLPETAVPVETRRGSGLAVARFAAPAPARRVGLVYRGSSGRADEFGVLAASIRRAIRSRRLPVQLLDEN
jgi:LysR family hydrogen peroxide-inducible transcriptional activator